MTQEIHFYEKNFDQISAKELYQILRLRSAVFVVEQDCVYQDIDNKDEYAFHIIGKIGHEIVAYARCFPPEFYFEDAAIGRVLVTDSFRGFGYAHQLIDTAISAIYKKFQTSTIKISAQQHLEKFYQSHGFKTVGEGYLEDGIPHITMVRKSNL